MATKILSDTAVKIKTSPKTEPRLRVCIGLSGGVDSSVAAALLKKQGYEVIGVYMKNWNTTSPQLGRRPLSADEYRMECPWYEEYLDAKRVALHLQIPFKLWDFRQAYKKKVFDHFIDEFEAGRTPNPDVYCNSLVKFEDFEQRAREELKVDYVATGHYAAVNHGLVNRQGEPSILSLPADRRKDQTYFLYRLNQNQLKRALFPLADLTKTQVRALARKFNLPTQYKKDSQGLCFIGPIKVRSFISQWLTPKVGAVVNENGRVIGRHEGVPFYTLGEKVAVDNEKVVKLLPELKRQLPTWYIAHKDIRTNRLVAVPAADHPTLFKSEASIDEVSWIWTIPAAGQKVQARLRHGGALVLAKVAKIADDSAIVAFDQPQRAVTPGQHLVLYDLENRVLGGGVIHQPE